MFAVRVEIDGSVCVVDAGAFDGPETVDSQGRWATVVSMAAGVGRSRRSGGGARFAGKIHYRMFQA